MFKREVTIENNYSFFLLGPRGSGKSTLLRGHFSQRPPPLWIDLLDPDEEALFQVEPGELQRRCQPLPPQAWVVIDEIQKVPKLLDLVHKLIEERQLYFALSGSSARKLKRGGANLLAGRAFVQYLYPLTSTELAHKFDISQALSWGTLPKIWAFPDEISKKRFLQAYAHTYLKEEIQTEQIVRNLPAFRKFLDVAAQMNGQPTNYSHIARDILGDHTVVRNYFEILEDTLLGFRVPAFDRSLRKQQRHAPKFYFIDIGILRALQKTLDIPIQPKSYEYGRLFESFIVSELYKHCQYRAMEESLYYLQTKDGVEIDLIMTRPGKTTLFLEIKSTDRVMEHDCATLGRFTRGLTDCQAFLLSQDVHCKAIEHVSVCHWSDFLTKWLAGRI